MTNNVKSCKKINGRAQTFKFSVFTMGRQELLAKNMKELRKLGKLKRLFLNFFKYYDPPRVAQCEIIQKNQWKSSNFQIQCFYKGTAGALC